MSEYVEEAAFLFLFFLMLFGINIVRGTDRAG